jgi:tetratricopeptide (TPR) repeat protein/tRNA A-37 threonylcarbamoyl transferase component Bud32
MTSDASTLPLGAGGPVLRPGDTVSGRFLVEDLVGAGGMGEIARAFDATLERQVALKAVRSDQLQDPEALGRLKREALALAQLNHPNICQVHDWVETAGGAYLALEWVEGKTLDQAAQGKSLKDRLRLLRQVLAGMEAAHAKGLVHRDLKPANVMVTAEGAVKVLDFGLARLADLSGTDFSTPSHVPNLSHVMIKEPSQSQSGKRSSVWEGMTQAGLFMGSPAYASPEQIGGKKVGPPSDLFSFGILAWELLCGEHPFPFEGRQRMQAILGGHSKPFPKTFKDRKLRELLERCLSREPVLRPTAAEVGAILDKVLAPAKAGPWVVGAVCVAVGVGSVGTWLHARGAIADLTRSHPARMVILPFENGTGDTRFTGHIGLVLPEETMMGLANQPHLELIDQETFRKAARKLGLELGKPMDGEARKALMAYLGAALLLRGEVHREKEVSLDFTLEDLHGKVRSKGHLQRAGELGLALQALPSDLVAQLDKSIAPLGRKAVVAVREPLSSSAYLAYGQAKELLAKGGFKDALPLYQAAATQAPFAPGPVVGYASCLYRLGDPSAGATLHWAQAVARLAGDRTTEAAALKVLALKEREQGHLEEAARAGREALALLNHPGMDAPRASILNNLGLVLQDQEKVEEALQCFNLAADIQRRLPDPTSLAQTLNNLAVLARKRGAFPEAETRYQEALSLSRTQQDHYSEALALTNLGDLALSLQRFDEARHYIEQADTLYQAAGNRTERAMDQINLGVLNQVQSLYEPAERAYQTARVLSEESQAAPQVALAWFYLAGLSRQRGRTEEAAARYGEAARRFQSLGSMPEWAEAQAGLAECWLLRTPMRIGEADRLLQEAAKKGKADSPFLLRASYHLARVRGQKDLAKALLAQAIAAAKRDQPEVWKELDGLR